jgi:AcrR family transcriptional regulator
MATTTRERLVETAHGLFYREGFHTVGLDRILGEVGVTKTTFYNHFQSKDDLMLEVLRRHDRWWRDTFQQKLREYGGDTPRGQLEAVFDVVEELFNSGEYSGCIFINVAVEFPLPHDPAHQAAAEHKATMESIIRELAGYAGAADASAFAREFTLLMEGAYVTQHITRRDDTASSA